METVKMSNEERITKAQAIFLGRFYFQCYGGFDRNEFDKKMEEEFKILKFGTYNGSVLGEASMITPTITLYADKGKVLNSFEIRNNIKRYCPVILHELIHKFLMKRNKDGKIVSTGMHKLIYNDLEFKNYLGDSLINFILGKLNPIVTSLFKTDRYLYDFGFGANEGYTEWFRKNILKNEEKITYLELTEIFDTIQKKLEKNGKDAIQLMKNFKDGNYEYIFNIMNMSKKTGILFIRYLDYLYIKEYEQKKIKEYLENKKIQKILEKKQEKKEELNDVKRFCLYFENLVREKFGKSLSEEDIIEKLNYYAESNKQIQIDIRNFLRRMLNFSIGDNKVNDVFCFDKVSSLKLEVLSINRKNMNLFANLKNAFKYKDHKEILIKKKKHRSLIVNWYLKKSITIMALSSLLLTSSISLKNYLGKKVDYKVENEIKNDSIFDKLSFVFVQKNIEPKKKIILSKESDIIEHYFSNGFSLKRGQHVYLSSCDNQTVSMKCDYQNLYCDNVKVVKNNEIINEGSVADINDLYLDALSNEGNIRLRLGVKASNNSIIYIAWIDLQEIIDGFNKKEEHKLILQKQ